jgi:hypothetical protein
MAMHVLEQPLIVPTEALNSANDTFVPLDINILGTVPRFYLSFRTDLNLRE